MGRSRGGLIGRLADEFDLAWQNGSPSIEHYFESLLKGEAAVLDAVGRLALLEELIKIDLEYRWKPGPNRPAESPWSIADYSTRFPELQVDGYDPAELVAEEFRARWTWGDRPARAQYIRAYPAAPARLDRMLQGIENEFSRVTPARPPVAAPPIAPAKAPVTPTQPPDVAELPTYRSEQTAAHVSRREGEAPPSPIVVLPAAKESSAEYPSVPGYVITGVLGRGGMGVVYKAYHEKLKRVVALKMILSGPFADPGEMKRFRAEAEAVARLSHPNILQVYDLGDCDSRPFIALEYVEGGSLSRRLAGEPQSPGPAAALIETLADAVHHAHQAGIVHRDLKPGNILLADSGSSPAGNRESITTLTNLSPKIADFGLAKTLDDASDQTRTGQILGTPSYMAPEQAAGRVHDTGPPADVYALGAILYELVTGRPPFRGASSIETLHQVQSQEPVAPRLLQPGCPRDLETIILKCLQKDPAQRYKSAAALKDDLVRLREGRPILARPAGPLTRAWKFYRRNPIVVYFIAALLGVTFVSVVAAGITIIGGAALTLSNRERDRQLYRAQIAVAERELTLRQDVPLAEELLDECPPRLRGWEWYYLMRLRDGPRDPLDGHEGGLWAVAWSPDDRRLATTSIDGTVIIWDAASGRPVARFTGHKVSVAGIDTAVARQLQDHTDSLLQLASGGMLAQPFQKVPKHISPVLCVAFSPDSTDVFSGALAPNVNAPRQSAGEIKRWTADGRELFTFQRRHERMVTTLAISPDGSLLASAGMEGDHTWTLSDTRSGEVRHIIKGHRGWVTQVRFSPDGKRIATGSVDGTIKIWDAATREEITTLIGHDALVRGLAFSADGRRLASASMDGSVRVWEVRGGEPVVLRGHTGAAMGVAFHPEGERVASAGFDRTVRLWDPAAGGRDRLTLRGHREVVMAVAFSSDGQRLASAGFDGTARIWDATPTAEAQRSDLFTLTDHADRANRVALNADGSLLATASWDQTVGIWDARTGTRLRTLKGHTGAVWGVAFNRDGDLIASASWDGTVRVWDAATGAERLVLPCGGMPVHCVAFRPDGRRLTAGCWDGTVHTWDMPSGQKVEPIEGHYLPVMSVAYSRDGRYLATASGDRSVGIWDGASGQRIARFEAHSATVYGVAFDPTQASHLAVASWDGTVSLWDVRRPQSPLRVLGHRVGEPGRGPSHTDYVCGVAFSPDGRHLATVGNDKALRIWNAATGAALDARPMRGVLWDVAFHPDSRRVAVVCWNPRGWVKMMPVEP